MFSFVDFKENDESFQKLSSNSLLSTINDEKEEKPQKPHIKQKHKQIPKKDLSEAYGEQQLIEGLYSPMLPPLYYNNINYNLMNANYAHSTFPYSSPLFAPTDMSNPSVYASMKAQFCMNLFSDFVKSQCKHILQ